ncbi:BRCA1-A complex subunit RAP80 isoform X2 [Tiliqua scincoides]|uniref:BRCA1-A complex subunit RAP80 isoform X2 n=1 Tax=Tiliqua scincoides TaxID=71010 RepID=UPI003461851C
MESVPDFFESEGKTNSHSHPMQQHESKEEHCMQKKRTKQQLDRAKFAAKRKIAHMTEDEQFALALKMSEQEALQLNSQEEEEEELLRKAIAESLSNCQPSDSHAATALPLVAEAPGSPVESHPAGQEASEILAAQLPCSVSPCSKCSSLLPSDRADENGETDVAKRPLVVLTRLSQEIVESSLVSSIIVSPGKSQPFARSNENPSSLAESDSSDTPLSLEEENSFTLSPTFPQRPPVTWPPAPLQLFAGGCHPSSVTSKETDNHSQNCSQGDQLVDCSEVLKKVPQEHSILDPTSSPDPELGQQLEQREKARISPESMERTAVSENAPPLCTLPVADEYKQEEDQDTVHYYWGVPFCPRGVDPNKYTQVILCQLEVYQKSLKQAQRQLLQKKKFGEPVLPSMCSSLRRSECRKGKETFRGSEGTDEQEGEDVDEKKEPDRVAWLTSPTIEEPNKNADQNMSEVENAEYRDEPASSSSQASQVLFAEDALEEGEPMQITQSISALTPLDSKRSPDITTENCAEEEITICPETQPSPSQAIEPESREIHSSSKDVSLQANVDGEDAERSESACSPPADGSMSCPLCDRTFPVSEIQLHAMYCYGTGQDTTEDAPVMTRQQREAKNKASCGKEKSESVDIDKYEKCYICKTLVPWKEYQKHVDACLGSRTANGTQSGRRLQHSKEEGRSEGRLLSMLEESEHKATDADMAAVLSREEGSRYSSADADKEVGCNQDVWCPFPKAACSDSPIKSFTSISEAKDCLVDFKKQLVIGSGSRQQTKASLKSRKKF